MSENLVFSGDFKPVSMKGLIFFHDFTHQIAGYVTVEGKLNPELHGTCIDWL